MRKVNILIMLLVSLSIIGFVSATANPGSIWTTTITCGDPQNDNEYAVGENVYINGANFYEGTYNWDISGNPFKEADKVASGTITVNNTGKFCFNAYTVQMNDSGEYKANVNEHKSDNYHVFSSIPVAPEFGTVVGVLTILGALGVFFVVR